MNTTPPMYASIKNGSSIYKSTIVKNRVTVIGLYGMSLLLGMEAFPRDGQTVVAGCMAVEPGGKGFNQAVSAARSGSSVNFITAVGNDAFGKRLFEDCAKEHIACEYSVVLEEPTASAAVLSDALGASRVIVARGACDAIRSANMREGWQMDCKVLLLQHETPAEITLYAAEKCAQSGSFIILNPAPARIVSPELMRFIDLIVPNWGEALELVGAPDTEEPRVVATKLREMGARNVIITLGEKGIYVLLEDKTAYLKPAPSVRVVNTTGAGDTFCGVLASCIADGMPITESARRATMAASLSVTKQGVIQAIPTTQELDRFINGAETT